MSTISMHAELDKRKALGALVAQIRPSGDSWAFVFCCPSMAERLVSAILFQGLTM
jgi:hypothetical protein